jgi:hypothetical protein
LGEAASTNASLRVARLAVLRGRRETKLRWSELKRQLDRYDEGKLEAWLAGGALPPAAAAALSMAAAPGVVPAAEQTAGSLDQWQAQLQTWRRIELLPGLELLVAAHATPAALRAAQLLCAEYLK